MMPPTWLQTEATQTGQQNFQRSRRLHRNDYLFLVSFVLSSFSSISHRPHIGDGAIFQETSSSSEILRGISYETQLGNYCMYSLIFGHQFGYILEQNATDMSSYIRLHFQLCFTRECENMARMLCAQNIHFEF